MAAQTKRPPRKTHPTGVLALIILLVVLAAVLRMNYVLSHTEEDLGGEASPSADALGETPPEGDSGDETDSDGEGEVEVKETVPEFAPYSVSSTEPSRLLSYTNVMVNGEITDSYSAVSENVIDFLLPQSYTAATGVLTFRGNNFRDSPTYRTANISNCLFESKWSVGTGNLTAPDGYTWTGSGWVGQPLITTWSKEVRATMNMYDWAKEQDELVEVIYATMDGNIYFLELSSGKATRDPIYIGYTFKGSGSLDPRGYPILYVGSGYNSNKGTSHAFVISLIDGSILYEFGAADEFSLRGVLSFFDSAPLIDAETDQLIYPGENGVLYIIKLNSVYDASTGELSVNPSNVVKWRYYGTRSSTASYWLGMEDSLVIWRGHAIFSDNGGLLICLDLNTLETVWVQDVLDDTNGSPVLELEDDHPYIYISTSFHLGWRSSSKADVPVWKIDAVTGEIVWQKDYSCYSVSGTSGGVQGTVALGKRSLENLIFVPVARTPSEGSGLLVAIDKQTGEEVWQFKSGAYGWSSPVAVYNAAGDGYVLYCTTGGYMYLLDGLTGELLDTINLEGNIEASPAVYNSTIVVGTRSQKIWGIDLT